jgi:hypothetical protein
MKSADQDSLYETLGFIWDRSAVRHDAVVHDAERAAWRFHYALPSYVWDAAQLEGNPLTYIDVKTMVDGYAVGGHKLSDMHQVLNLTEAARELYRLVRAGEFRLTGIAADRMNLLIRRGVAVGEPVAADLHHLHREGIEAILADIPGVFEQALAYFMFGALRQFYPVTWPTVTRWQVPLVMMNGTLMSGGIDPVSVPVDRHREFYRRMADFRKTLDGTGMFAFLASCYNDWG